VSIDCIGELDTSYASHRLQLNATKNEFIWFGSRSVLSKIPHHLHQVTIRLTTVHCYDVVLDLGVYLDSELMMKKQDCQHLLLPTTKTLPSVQTGKLAMSVMKQLSSFVLQRIDYCKSLLSTSRHLQRCLCTLQRVQNDAARLDRRAHITHGSTGRSFNTEFNSKCPFLCTSVFIAVVHSTYSI